METCGPRGLAAGLLLRDVLGFNDHNGTAISIAEVQIEKWHPDNLVSRDAARNAALGLLSIGISTPDGGTRGHHPVITRSCPVIAWAFALRSRATALHDL